MSNPSDSQESVSSSQSHEELPHRPANNLAESAGRLRRKVADLQAEVGELNVEIAQLLALQQPSAPEPKPMTPQADPGAGRSTPAPQPTRVSGADLSPIHLQPTSSPAVKVVRMRGRRRQKHGEWKGLKIDFRRGNFVLAMTTLTMIIFSLVLLGLLALYLAYILTGGTLQPAL